MTDEVKDEADRTRVRLIQAAGKVFAEGGYEGAKVRDICALADVNVAAVNSATSSAYTWRF